MSGGMDEWTSVYFPISSLQVYVHILIDCWQEIPAGFSKNLSKRILLYIFWLITYLIIMIVGHQLC